MAEMTIKDALERLAELNDGMETLVKTNTSEPMWIVSHQSCVNPPFTQQTNVYILYKESEHFVNNFG